MVNVLSALFHSDWDIAHHPEGLCPDGFVGRIDDLPFPGGLSPNGDVGFPVAVIISRNRKIAVRLHARSQLQHGGRVCGAIMNEPVAGRAAPDSDIGLSVSVIIGGHWSVTRTAKNLA